MAADYRQYDPIEKRVRYFDGQFLKDQDFVDEQKYHLDRQRRSLRFLHVSGIVDGLTVEPGSQQSPDDADRALVRPGTAIDTQGQQIVLSSVKDLPLKDYRNQSVEVFIAYQEIASDVAQEGGESNRRWHEDPLITVQKVGTPPPDHAIRLAKLNINGDGNVTPDADTTVRQYAGVTLPSAEGANLTLRSRGTAAKDWAILTGSLSVTGRVGIGTVSPNAKLEVNLATPSTEPSLKLEHIGSNLIVRPLTAGGAVSVVENTGGGALLINPTIGNVGIGSNEATNRLHVSGTLGIRQNYQYLSGNAGGSSLSYNAHRNADNSNWVFPDRNRASVTVEMDDLSGKQPRFQIFSTTSADTGSWIQRFALDGNTGNVAIAHSGGTVGIGTGAGTPKLTIAASSDHLQLIRSKAETTGGKKLFLELFQEDPTVTVPEVLPSLRFHHGGRFWHRIEAQTSGLHFKTGDLNSDAYVKIFAENMIVTGMIVMWSGRADAIPSGWALCNGQNNTPNLIDRFIIGTVSNFANLQDSNRFGGAASHSHSTFGPNSNASVLTNVAAAGKDRTDAALSNHGHGTPETSHLPPFYRLAFIIKL